MELTEQLAAHLIEKGYVLCDDTGTAKEPGRRHTNVVGLLLPDKTLRQRRIMGIFKPKPRRVHLGSIWTKSIIREATPEYWLFEVIGRELFNEALQLAKELQEHFKVKINVRVVRDELAGEVFPGELDD
jgi:hypothetical protein